MFLQNIIYSKLRRLKIFLFPRWPVLSLRWMLFYLVFLLCVLTIYVFLSTNPNKIVNNIRKANVPHKPNRAEVENILRDAFNRYAWITGVSSQHLLEMSMDTVGIWPPPINIRVCPTKSHIETLFFNFFLRADLDGDSKLTIQELGRFINSKIRDHIDDAIRTNPLHFAEMDVSPKDGLISWNEYERYFLKSNGYSNDFQEGKSSYIKLERSVKGQ